MQFLDPLRRYLRVHPREVAAALGLAGLGLIYAATGRPLLVVVDGEAHNLRTHARTVAHALHDAGLDPNVSDWVVPALSAPVTSGMTIRLDRARPVWVDAEGQRAMLETPERRPANILAQAGVRLYPGDRLWVDGVLQTDPTSPPAFPPMRLRVRRGVTITLRDGTDTRQLRSAAPSLAEALWESGVRLREGDLLSAASDSPVTAAMAVGLLGTRQVTIRAEGREFQARVRGETVGEAMATVGLAPVDLDFTIPGTDEPIPEDGVIRLVRVREELLVEQEPIPFETVYEAIPDLEIDSQRLIEAGGYGVVVHQVRIRLEDGEEVERTVEGEWTAVEPRPQRVGYGTRIEIRTLDTPDGVIEYWRAARMYATSYSPSRSGTSPDAPWYGITYSGKRLVKGLVAIDLRYIPMGTRMYVPGYGFAEAADIGGGVRGRWIDLGYSDDDFVNWHQWVTVYFLTPIPPLNSIVWIFP